MKDNRYVYGATCSFMGTIDKVGKTEGPVLIPCCPHCKGVLFEVESEDEWYRMAKEFEAEGHPNYVDFIKWVAALPSCSREPLQCLIPLFKQSTGKDVSF